MPVYAKYKQLINKINKHKAGVPALLPLIPEVQDSFIIPVFEYVSGLAIQRLADIIQSRETDCLGLLILKYGKIRRCYPYLLCEVSGGDLPLSHHYIKIDNDHIILPLSSDRKIHLFFHYDRFLKYDLNT